MKVLIDVAHPAHIHYLRNFANEFQKKGHKCLFTLRDKGIIIDLAKHYELNYQVRSKERKSKILYMLSAFYNVFKISLKFKPDLYIDAGTVVAAPISKLFGKPYIALEDTEVATKAVRLFKPFANYILTPSCFYKDLGNKQIRFNGLLELFYLHKNYFEADTSEISEYITDIDNYVLIRFVSWEAHHDVGKTGISLSNKIKLIENLEDKHNILISAEGELPEKFLKYRSTVPVHLMHQAMAKAKFVITEGATMASEAVILGVPTIYINSIQNGYTNEQANRGLLYSIADDELLFEKLSEVEILLSSEIEMEKYRNEHKSYLDEKIDMTKFLVNLIENYSRIPELIDDNRNYIENKK